MAKVVTDIRYDTSTPDTWPDERKTDLTLDLVSAMNKALSFNVERAIRLADIATKYQLWGFVGRGSFDELLENTSLTTDAIEQYRKGVALLRDRGHQGPITRQQAAAALVESITPEKAAKGKRGRPSKDDINKNLINYKQGPTAENILRRLIREEKNELVNAIKYGEISINQAAIQAGYRKAKSPDEIAVANFRKSENKLHLLKNLIDSMEDQERYMLRACIGDWLK